MSTSGKYSKVHADLANTEISAQSVDLLGSDFAVVRADSLIHLTICTDVQAVFAIVTGDNATFHLNSGSPIAANGLHHETFSLPSTGTYNVQMLSTGSGTLKMLRIVEQSLV